MLKYINSDIVFQEIPDEVTLAINISNCPCRCPGCHSKFLWADTGTPLTEMSIDDFVAEFGQDMTCICFMGGDAEPAEVNRLAMYIRDRYAGFKIGWYTGRTLISPLIDTENFDYIKVGPYIAHLGPLKSPTTNQRLYLVDHSEHRLEDVTGWFQKKR